MAEAGECAPVSPEAPAAGDTAPAMVFYAPYPVLDGPATGSAVRPGRIRQAFRDLGYRVFDFTGDGALRRARLGQLRAELGAGLAVDFCYGENSTMPTLLTQSHHLPTHPLVDLNLFRLLRRYEVPTGMFYRDIYWRFGEYTERVHPIVAAGTRSLYHAELLAYRSLLDRVYLPSDKIARYVPHLRPEQVRALPPGGFIHDIEGRDAPVERSDEAAQTVQSGKSKLTVLYVGNISTYYRMHELLAAVVRTPGVRFILCTPAESWAAVEQEYRLLLDAARPGQIEIVHRSGDELSALFAQADVCALVVEPSEYRDFAAPVKLFEYVGYGKPLLVSAGTHAAELVTADDLGWVVPYDAAAVADLLHTLVADPARVRRATGQVRSARERHTWQARAAQVAADLSCLDTRRPVS